MDQSPNTVAHNTMSTITKMAAVVNKLDNTSDNLCTDDLGNSALNAVDEDVTLVKQRLNSPNVQRKSATHLGSIQESEDTLRTIYLHQQQPVSSTSLDKIASCLTHMCDVRQSMSNLESKVLTRQTVLSEENTELKLEILKRELLNEQVSNRRLAAEKQALVQELEHYKQQRICDIEDLKVIKKQLDDHKVATEEMPVAFRQNNLSNGMDNIYVKGEGCVLSMGSRLFPSSTREHNTNHPNMRTSVQRQKHQELR